MQSLTKEDEINQTEVYKRKEIEYKEIIKRLYGPFFTGHDEDDISILSKLNKDEIIKKIIDSTDLNNAKLSALMEKANVLETNYTEQGTELKVILSKHLYELYKNGNE